MATESMIKVGDPCFVVRRIGLTASFRSTSGTVKAAVLMSGGQTLYILDFISCEVTGYTRLAALASQLEWTKIGEVSYWVHIFPEERNDYLVWLKKLGTESDAFARGDILRLRKGVTITGTTDRKITVYDPSVPWTFAVGAFKPRRTRTVFAYSYPEARQKVKELLDSEEYGKGSEPPVAWDLELLED